MSGDGRVRCPWAVDTPGSTLYRDYHDTEWGRELHGRDELFERLCLEAFQSGLSWLTILRKRENFRAAFADFDFEKVASFDQDDVERLVADAGIIRHRGKIVSTINNARRAVELRDEFGSLAKFFWSFEPSPADRPAVMDLATLRANPTTATSIRLSKDLKKRGWSFVGPTTVYAFMQAMGLVNDHLAGCFCRAEIDRLRAEFIRP